MIRDLLNPSSGFLELREDSKGVVVAGISELQAKKTSEVGLIFFTIIIIFLFSNTLIIVMSFSHFCKVP